MKCFLTIEKNRFLFKVLRIMRMTTLLMLLFALQLSAKGFAQQKLNLQFKKTEIGEVLSSIEKKSDYRFLYNNELKDIRQKVTFSVQDADIKQVLDLLFSNTVLSYRFMGNDLIIIKNTVDSIAVDAKNTITGKVTGDNGIALNGVSVLIKGTAKGTTTNANGVYSISVSDDASLIFSYVGYESQEVAVAGKTEINVSMVLSKKELDQVVVIGYGTQKKRDLTGSIAVVSGDQIAKMPSTNPVASLQGLVAGLTIVNSGQAGASPTVRIRGVNSTNNADPIYVVDGILQTNIDYLNQADIESIEVLKDPSSISIYGLQGGNGVIIITTKRAKRGETKINFQSSVSLQDVIHKIDVVDASGFQKLYNEQIKNVNGTPFNFSNYTANTNWQDQIYRNAVMSSNSLSISNSTDKSTTYLNIGYSNQDGVVKYDNYQKYIGRLNEEIRVNKNIRVGGEVNGFYFTQNPPEDAAENEALWAAPIIPIQAGPGLYYSTPSFQRAQVANPLALVNLANGTTLNSGYRVTADVFAEIKFLKNFTWKSTFYTDLSFNESRGYSPTPYTFINLDVANGYGGRDTTFVNQHTGVSQSFSQYKTYQQDHLLTFDKNFKGGSHITVLAGFSTIYHYNDFINGSRTDTSLNIPNNPIFWFLNIAQASNPGNFAGGGSNDASMSFLGRVNYSFKGKYLVNLSFRRDGTSKFSPTNEWGNFGSVGAGWVVSDENFMQNIKWLNFFKLKGSWGTVGNGNIGNSLYYPALNNSNVGIFGNNIYPAVSPAYIPDPNLHWEVVEGKDAGFETRLFKNRLNLDVDFYDRKTNGILTYVTLPGSSGNLPYLTNLGTIDNKGLEISAGWTDHISRDFNFSVNGNFSVNTNNVVSLGNAFNFEITNGINDTKSGFPIGAFYGYQQIGIYQSPKEVLNGPYVALGQAAQPGDIIYKDVDGNDTINGKDRTYLGVPFPKFNYGLSISLSYKNFDLAIQGQGVAGNEIYLQRRTYNFAVLNYESNRLDAWTGSGTSNTEPILDPSRSNNYVFSNYWLESGSYFRIRTLQIGYTFNPERLKRLGITMFRLYISGQNIATFTKATGYSPEVPIDSPTTAGADNGVYPIPAVYSFGLNLTF
jgi:TonB-linked SusC/RagA family outer membrane protein